MAIDRDALFNVVQTAETFCARHILPGAADLDHADSGFPEATFSHGVKAGFDRFTLPESAGGYGFDLAALCALIRTLAQTCAGHAMVFGVHAAIVNALQAFATDAHLAKIFESGRPVGCTMPEPLGENDIDAPSISDPFGLAINSAAGGFVVTFAKNDQWRLLACLANAGADGFVLGEPESVLGLRAMPLRELAFDRGTVDSGSILAEGSDAHDFYRCLVGRLCLVVAAAASGLAQSASRQALEYAGQRYQGGGMIIDHSHLRSLLGRMCAQNASAGGSLMAAAQDGANLSLALAVKFGLTEQAVDTCTDAVQILGGYGYMREYGLEKKMRDAAVLSLLPVSNERAKLMVAQIEKRKLT